MSGHHQRQQTTLVTRQRLIVTDMGTRRVRHLRLLTISAIRRLLTETVMAILLVLLRHRQTTSVIRQRRIVIVMVIQQEQTDQGQTILVIPIRLTLIPMVTPEELQRLPQITLGTPRRPIETRMVIRKELRLLPQITLEIGIPSSEAITPILPFGRGNLTSHPSRVRVGRGVGCLSQYWECRLIPGYRRYRGSSHTAHRF